MTELSIKVYEYEHFGREILPRLVLDRKINNKKRVNVKNNTCIHFLE